MGSEVFISQHVGDLETGPSFAAFRRIAADLPRLYEASPVLVACDRHADYLSAKYARETGLQVHPVQHHWAHVLACMAENELDAPVLGVSWDGTGLGLDGTVWGGEFLLATGGASFQRVAHLRQFRLPGAEAAIKQPRRCALGLLFEMWGDKALRRNHLAPLRDIPRADLAVIGQMLARGLNSPLTSSAGRLFDAGASILGLRQQAGYEGQAAMALEFAAGGETHAAYPFHLRAGPPLVLDWQPMIEAMLADDQPAGVRAARFHATLAEMVVAVAQRMAERRIVLTGGCFQNRLLTETCVQRLVDAGFQTYWHQRIPPNDGGLALGQIVAAQKTYDELSAR